MKTIYDILKSHPFFKDFPEEDLQMLSSCAQNKVYQPGEIIAKENAPANEFYLIRQGQVAITTPIPHRDNQIIQTIGEGDIFGWSWLFPPHRWMFEASALQETRVITLDGKCLRDKLEKNPELGFKVMKQFSQMMVERLHATRLQLLDAYR
jgi:CRP/FNR family transcriptional regulator, cyclic AMP receptor protein